MNVGAFLSALVAVCVAAGLGWLGGGAAALAHARTAEPHATLFIGYIGAAIAGIAAVIAIWGVYSQRVLTRRQTTVEHLFSLKNDASVQANIQKFIALSRGNQNLAKWADEEHIGKPETLAIIAVMNDFELMAVGIQHGIYEYELVKRFQASTIKRFWSAAHPFVVALRTRTQTPTIWCETEKLHGWVTGAKDPFRHLWWTGFH